MKVLIACEESQTVCKAFRTKGHEAYSADIQDCSGGHPEWHIKGDVLPIINGNADFVTMDGTAHRIDGKWDLLIAHPPCTYLTNVATRHYSLKCTPAEKVIDRMEHREEAIVFFMQCMLADAPRIAVENPIGRMGKVFRKADQIIHPYMFSGGGQLTRNSLSQRQRVYGSKDCRNYRQHISETSPTMQNCSEHMPMENHGRGKKYSVPGKIVQRSEAKHSQASPKLWRNSGDKEDCSSGYQDIPTISATTLRKQDFPCR